jgi:hypothetical protein
MSLADVTPVQRLAIEASLKALLTGKYFDICRLKDCLEVCGISPHTKAFDTLRLLHCIHYSDMNDDLKKQIPDLVADCFGQGTVLTLSSPRLPRGVYD